MCPAYRIAAECAARLCQALPAKQAMKEPSARTVTSPLPLRPMSDPQNPEPTRRATDACRRSRGDVQARRILHPDPHECGQDDRRMPEHHRENKADQHHMQRGVIAEGVSARREYDEPDAGTLPNSSYRKNDCLSGRPSGTSEETQYSEYMSIPASRCLFRRRFLSSRSF